MSRRVCLANEVDDYKANAGTGHGHEEKYQTCFQGAQTLGPSMTLLQIHFDHSGEKCTKLCLVQQFTKLVLTQAGPGCS